jgi:radical SAM protein with 4Fe4S-binding SPASM domain
MIPTAKLADETGVGGIRVIRTTEAPRWAETGGDLCLGVREYYDFALDFTRAYLEAGLKPSVDIWQVLSFRPDTKSYHHRPVEGGRNIYRDSIPVCRGARGRVSVTPEGDTVPCNQLSGYFKKHGISIGNVFKTPLRELLSEGEYIKTICYTVGELKDENPRCQNCGHWKLCMGGCRAIGLVLGGGYKHYDPMKCVYFDEYFDKIAALFGEGWICEDDL